VTAVTVSEQLDNVVAPPAFRAAMSRFATGVTVVTTRDEENRPYGFTASSFCSVSLDPPLILVCLARTANSFQVFARSPRFAVSILQAQHAEVAARFATKRADKFDGCIIAPSPSGLPVVAQALAVVECELRNRHEAGDHIIMVGQVYGVQLSEGSPMVYFERAFHRLASQR
jgi:flavin reductase ActVB